MRIICILKLPDLNRQSWNAIILVCQRWNVSSVSSCWWLVLCTELSMVFFGQYSVIVSRSVDIKIVSCTRMFLYWWWFVLKEHAFVLSFENIWKMVADVSSQQCWNLCYCACAFIYVAITLTFLDTYVIK